MNGMANEDPNKINADPEAGTEDLDLGDELEGNDPDTLAAAAGEGEGEDEGEEDGDAAKPKGSQSVPHGRFNEVLNRAKIAEETLQAEREARIRLEEQMKVLKGGSVTEKQPEPEPAFDMKAKIKERNAAILEGDDDKVAEIELEIEQYRIAEAEERAVQRIERQSQQTALQKAAEDVVATYPFLNSTLPDADKEAIGEVKEWRDYYIGKGVAPHTALAQAVQRLKPMLDAKLGGAAPAPAAKTAEELAAEKRAASAKRNAGAANSQPPPPSGQSNGITPSTIDPDKMSGDDWMKLPEKERERHLA